MKKRTLFFLFCLLLAIFSQFALHKNYNSVTLQTIHFFARPQQSILTEPIVSPSCWTGPELQNATNEWRIVLSEEDQEYFVRLVKELGTKNITMKQLTKDDFPLSSSLARIISECEKQVDPQLGRGFQVLRGLPVTRLSEEESSLLFWGIGLHMGTPGAQNSKGDLLGHVRDEFRGKGQPDSKVRQYRTNEMIDFHCDAADVVGLLCLAQGAEGGASRLVSSTTVYNKLLEKDPALVPLLYSSQYLDVRGEGGVQYIPVEPATYSEGVLRTFYHTEYFRTSYAHPGLPAMDPKISHLLDVYDSLTHDPSLYLDMDFQVGDAQFVSNHVILHARTAYKDAEGKNRHLLRLWLSTKEKPLQERLTSRSYWLSWYATVKLVYRAVFYRTYFALLQLTS